jgi:hypothetical protein
MGSSRSAHERPVSARRTSLCGKCRRPTLSIKVSLSCTMALTARAPRPQALPSGVAAGCRAAAAGRLPPLQVQGWCRGRLVLAGATYRVTFRLPDGTEQTIDSPDDQYILDAGGGQLAAKESCWARAGGAQQGCLGRPVRSKVAVQPRQACSAGAALPLVQAPSWPGSGRRRPALPAVCHRLCARCPPNPSRGAGAGAALLLPRRHLLHLLCPRAGGRGGPERPDVPGRRTGRGCSCAVLYCVVPHASGRTVLLRKVGDGATGGCSAWLPSASANRPQLLAGLCRWARALRCCV